MEQTAADISVKRLMKFTGEGSIKAYADIAIDEQFLIKGVRVVEGKRGMFVSMPRQQTKDGKWFDSVQALTQQAKASVERIVLDAYQQQGPVDKHNL